jgi:hypothetical protein
VGITFLYWLTAFLVIEFCTFRPPIGPEDAGKNEQMDVEVPKMERL